MQIDGNRVMELRRLRRWSQDELATAAGLNLRTVQRVESSGSASLQTLKAIAATFQRRIEEFEIGPEKAELRYEYKTLVLPMKMGFIKQGLPDLGTALNAEARSGWRLCQVITPTNSSGQTTDLVAVFERPAS